MPTTLTDSDSFGSPALVPVDGDAATASSVDAEFQVLQNRTEYDRLRAAEAKAEADATAAQLTGKRVVVAQGTVVGAGQINQTVTGATADLTYSSVNIPSLLAGDIVDYSLGPVEVTNGSAIASAFLTVVSSENGGGYGGEHQMEVYANFRNVMTLRGQHTIGAAGNFAMKLIGAGPASGATYKGLDLTFKFCTYTVTRALA